MPDRLRRPARARRSAGAQPSLLRRARTALAAGAIALIAAPAPASVADKACRYDVRPDLIAGMADLALDVRVVCDVALQPEDFSFGYGGAGFADWSDAGALRYRIRLGALARARSRADFSASGAGVLAPIDAWLAAPRRHFGMERLEIAFVDASDGVRPILNLEQTDDGRFVLEHVDWAFAGYAAFARRPPILASAPGPGAFAAPGRPGQARAGIVIVPLIDDLALSDAQLSAWIERFAGLTARFWAGFPADRLLIALTPGGRPGRLFGRVRGGGGATMLLRIAPDETASYLMTQDWVLTHELIHLGAPFAPRRVPWLMEGMATYLEPLLRAQGGAMEPAAVWREWLRAMPAGALAFNLEGLEGDGHPYWTGALIFLLAHVETARRGDPEALARCFRAVRRDLGGADRRATEDAVIAACDRAIGAPVVADLRRRFASPTDFDLTALWRELGVARSNDDVRLLTAGEDLRRMLFDPASFPEPTP